MIFRILPKLLRVCLSFMGITVYQPLIDVCHLDDRLPLCYSWAALVRYNISHINKVGKVR